MVVSNPEIRAMDIINYANRCGGIDNVLTVLTDLIKRIEVIKLQQLATSTSEITWAHHLGICLI
jgi:hypothetical protein